MRKMKLHTVNHAFKALLKVVSFQPGREWQGGKSTLQASRDIFFPLHDKTQHIQSLDSSLILSKDVFVSSSLGRSEDNGTKAFQDIL